MSATVGALVERAGRRLRRAGSASGRLDAQLLLGKASGLARTDILAHPERHVGEAEVAAFELLVARRAAAEPIAYLVGEREFYGRVFTVDRRALIPRPETELLVELGLAAVSRWRGRGQEPLVVEIGTGAGAVAISIAAEAGVRVLATDVSPAALELAAENARRLSVESLLQLQEANLLTGISGPVDVVLANLPYVPAERQLPPDVRDYEPHVAIFGGPRGTELIEELFLQARGRLGPTAEMAVELDEETQAAPMAALARELYPRADVSILRDAGGYDRVVRVALG